MIQLAFTKREHKPRDALQLPHSDSTPKGSSWQISTRNPFLFRKPHYRANRRAPATRFVKVLLASLILGYPLQRQTRWVGSASELWTISTSSRSWRWWSNYIMASNQSRRIITRLTQSVQWYPHDSAKVRSTKGPDSPHRVTIYCPCLTAPSNIRSTSDFKIRIFVLNINNSFECVSYHPWDWAICAVCQTTIIPISDLRATITGCTSTFNDHVIVIILITY